MRWLVALAALLAAAPGYAQVAPPFGMVPAGDTPSIVPGHTYILYRVELGVGFSATEPVFMREARDTDPDAQGDSARTNVYAANNKRAFSRGAREEVFLIDVRPGTYVFLGQNFHGAKSMATCWCFGTVKFVAQAGTITDMGFILIDRLDRVSAIPELAGVTGNRDKISPDLVRVAGGIRPYAEGMAVPGPIARLPRVAADYRAVGKFPNKFAYSINRLAPIPGILAYDEDRVIDVKAGAPGVTRQP